MDHLLLLLGLPHLPVNKLLSEPAHTLCFSHLSSPFIPLRSFSFPLVSSCLQRHTCPFYGPLASGISTAHILIVITGSGTLPVSRLAEPDRIVEGMK